MTRSQFNQRYPYLHCSVTGSILLFLALLFIVLLPTSPLMAAEKKKNVYQDEDIYLRFIYRSSEQVAAFYEGRGFPKAAIERAVQTCYVTIILKNRSDEVLWFELDNWWFHKNGKTISRYTQSYWNKQWDELKLKQAYRSTFGWTLFPESRDARPGESVSGNITIPKQTYPFSLTLNFARGENKKGKMKTVKLNDIYCKDAEKK